MYTFDQNSTTATVIMYPTGGYGNFLYHVLTEFVKDTVKPKGQQFNFSTTGNSHQTYKYTEPFL